MTVNEAIANAARKLWSALKFTGRWIGPTLIGLALFLLVFTSGAWGNVAGLPAMIGGILTAIACLFMRAPERQRQRKLMAGAAITALVFYGYGEWTLRQGYRTEEVSFVNQGVRLVGTLYLPEKPGKYPGMVVLNGSAATARGVNRGNAAPFARKGFAVLAYDRRGIGDSGGTRDADNFISAPRDLEPGAGDAAAAVEFLRTRPEVRPDAVGLMGISEGGFVLQRAAAISGNAAYMLIISAAPVPLSAIIRHQGGEVGLQQAKHDGFKEFDPMPSLKALDIQSLWLLARDDMLVPTGPSIAILEGLKKEGKRIEYQVYDDAWHGLFIGAANSVEEAMIPWLRRVTAQPSHITPSATPVLQRQTP